MRKIFIGFIILAILLLGTAFILTSLIPASAYKNKIEQQASATLGRDVKIKGDVKLSIFPSLRANAQTVSIANAPGFSDRPFASMDSLQANIKLLPLLKKQVEITKFTLINPKISLEKTKNGTVNWAFGDQDTPAKPELGKAFARDGRYTDLQISLGTFTLKNGKIDYVDATLGKTSSLNSVNLTMTMPGIDKPLTAKGDLVFNDTPITIDTHLETPKAFLNGQSAPFFINLKSDLISLTADGKFTPSNAITFDIAFEADIPSVSKLDTMLGIENPYDTLTESAKLNGKLSFDGNILTGTDTDISLHSDIMSTSFSGDFTTNTQPTASGDLAMGIKDLQALQQVLGMDIPQIRGLNTLDLTMKLTSDGAATTGNDIKMDVNGKSLNAQYTGNATFNAGLSFDGRLQASSPSVTSLFADLGLFTDLDMKAVPMAKALGKFNISSDVTGPVDALKLQNIDLALTEGLLNVTFSGSASTGETLRYDGHLNTDIPSLRQLAALGGTELPASTSQGEIYGPFSLSGQASGTTRQINFTDAELKLDHIVGTGKFSTDLRGAKPLLGGELDLQGLDLRPYMAAQNPTGEVQPWSEEPLNLAALNMFDANFILNTPNILVGRITLGQSQIKTSVKNGVLTTNIPNVSLYSGRGNLDMTLDATKNVPQIALDFTLNDMDGKGFLGAAAGFTKLTGNTGTSMSFRGAGRSQAEMMRSLNGSGNFELAEGVLSGVDIAQFVGGLETALQQGALPQGIGSKYTTPFNRLAGLFSVKNGVVSVGNFGLSSGTIRADGKGSLDLGQQMIDFSLRPRLKEGSGLASFGIPIRLQGSFGNVSAGLDTNLLTQIISARAKSQLQNEISKKVGGDVGALLGNLLGSGTSSQDPEKTPKDGEKKQKEDPVDKILKGLFGKD